MDKDTKIENLEKEVLQLKSQVIYLCHKNQGKNSYEFSYVSYTEVFARIQGVIKTLRSHKMNVLIRYKE